MGIFQQTNISWAYCIFHRWGDLSAGPCARPMDFQDFQSGWWFLFWWLKLLAQATYNSYSSVFRPGLQPRKESRRCLGHSAFVQNRRTEEQKLHVTACRVFTITPTLRVPKAEGLEAFRLSAVYTSNNLKFHSPTSKGEVEDKPPRAEVGDTSEWKIMAGPVFTVSTAWFEAGLDWVDDWVRHHVTQ